MKIQNHLKLLTFKKISISIALILIVVSAGVCVISFKHLPLKMDIHSSVNESNNQFKEINEKNTKMSNAEMAFGYIPNKFGLSFNSTYYSQKNNIANNAQEQLYLDYELNSDLFVDLEKIDSEEVVFAKLDNIDFNLTLPDGQKTSFETKNNFNNTLSELFAFSVNKYGKIENIYLSNKEEDFSAGIKRAIASRMQLIDKNNKASNWITEESNESGIYRAEYNKLSDIKVKKNIIEFVLPAYFQGKEPQQKIRSQDGIVMYFLNQDGKVDSINSKSSVVSDLELLGLNMRVSTNADIHWKSYSDRKLAKSIPSGYISQPLHLATTFDSIKQQNVVSKDPISIKSYLDEIKTLSLENDADQVSLLRDRLISSIHANPQILNDIRKIFEANLEDNIAAKLLGILTDVDTPEAQAALIELSNDASLSLQLRSHVLSHIALLQQPTVATISYLSEISKDTSQPENFRHTAIIALGAAVRSGLELKSDNMEMGYFQDAVVQLEQNFTQSKSVEERAAYILALGNAGQNSSKDLLMELSFAESDLDRTLAIDSLRFNNDSDVNRRVVDAINNDPSLSVRLQAIRSTVYRGDDGELNNALINSFRNAEQEEIRLAALDSLNLRDGKSEIFMNEVRVALYDSSSKIRNYAEKIINSDVNALNPQVSEAGDENTGSENNTKNIDGNINDSSTSEEFSTPFDHIPTPEEAAGDSLPDLDPA